MVRAKHDGETHIVSTLTLSQLENHLWRAADILRGSIDSGDYKHYIFGLLFFKRLSDVWEEEYEERLARYHDADLAADPDEHRFDIPKGHFWKDVRKHTTDIGTHLTMVFAALKLKTHRTIKSEALTNPNILVLTDRVDLHSQISSTFVACGLPNPTPVESIRDLHALSPDPSVLDFTADLKWVANFLLYGTQHFEKRQAFDQMNYSEKIREMLEKHLEATGLSVTIKLRHITDPDFWEDFDADGKTEEDLMTAAIRKTTELRKTVTERIDDSPHQYGKFSERLRQLLQKLESAQLSWAEKLKAAEELARDITHEDAAHVEAGLSHGAYGILQILNGFDAGPEGEELAIRLEGLYTDPVTAPALWWEKDGLRKSLRQQVRSMAHLAGLTQLKEIPEEVEAYALKHFAGQ